MLVSAERSATPFAKRTGNAMLDAKDKAEGNVSMWIMSRWLNFCTFVIKAEVKPSKMVLTCGKKWQTDTQIHSLRKRWF